MHVTVGEHHQDRGDLAGNRPSGIGRISRHAHSSSVIERFPSSGGGKRAVSPAERNTAGKGLGINGGGRVATESCPRSTVIKLMRCSRTQRGTTCRNSL